MFLINAAMPQVSTKIGHHHTITHALILVNL